MDSVHLQFFMAVHNGTETITYKIQSGLLNDVFSAPNISTGGFLNRLPRVIVTS